MFTKRPACRQPGRGAHQASSITSGLGAVPTKRVPQRSEDCLSDWAPPPAPSAESLLIVRLERQVVEVDLLHEAEPAGHS
ncbi:MAG: hypothetical protein ACLU0V_06195, partial [Eggerthella lenta]